MNRRFLLICIIVASCLSGYSQNITSPAIGALKAGFITPPNTAKPGVYWYFMDGNMTKASITKDLESMKKAGIGNLVFLEVNVGVPRGPVDFLSPQWQDLFQHAVRESERFDIEITLGIGPGWTGSGGPWVKPEQSMQHLVSAAIKVSGDESNIKLPVPPPKKPYFGDGAFTRVKKRMERLLRRCSCVSLPNACI